MRPPIPGTLISVALLMSQGVMAVPSSQACTALAHTPFEHVTVTAAEPQESGSFTPVEHGKTLRAISGLPGFCRVHGVARPVPGSQIGFEVWLPLQGWSQRLHMMGNGGYSSSIYFEQMADRLRRGDVAVSTDTGHTGGADDLRFVIDRPEALVDFAHRAVHETALAAKSIVTAFYSSPARYAYFTGCSTGGYQGLSEAQRYPEDFDGIIAGAPGNNRSRLNLAFLWNYEANHRPDNSQILPNSKLPMLTRAAVAACDRIDGVADGVINDPRDCHFDPAGIQCRAADREDCLTAEQVQTARKIYAGPRDARTGSPIYPGMTAGSEGIQVDPQELPGWAGYWANTAHPDEPDRLDFFRYWVFGNPHWDWRSFDWGADIDAMDQRLAGRFDANNPDLTRFAARKGKLIMFMGWQDPVGAAPEAINYYERVAARVSQAQSFLRLYMIPGMAHCRLGPGATFVSSQMQRSMPPVEDSKHDLVQALHEWVEHGAAPQTMIATHFENPAAKERKIAFQRPICPYPQKSRYIGGRTDQTASFSCGEPPRAPAVAATRAYAPLAVSISSDIRGTEPGVNRDSNTDVVLTHVLEGLMASREDGTPGPLIAEHVDISGDGRTYRFALRHGVRFHNGALLTSADVVWSWKRYLDPKNGWFCLPLFDGSHGARLISIEAPAPDVAVFQLDRPNPLFLNLMATLTCGATPILHPSSVNPDGSWRAPVGTGPYQLTSIKAGDSIELTAFKEYLPRTEARDGYTGAKIAYAPSIRFIVIRDEAARIAALMKGQVDVMTELTTPDILRLKHASNIHIVSAPGDGINVILIRSSDPLLADVRVRRALALSIDRRSVTLLSTAGTGQVNPSMIPVSSPYYDAEDIVAPGMNVELARRLLAEAGYKGQEITLVTTRRFNDLYDQALLVQAMARKAGINIRLVVTEWASQVNRYQAGDYQLMSFNYSARPDPYFNYEAMLGPPQGSARKVWRDPEAVTLLDTAAAEIDSAKRQAIFTELHRDMLESVPLIALFNPADVDAVRTNVTGFKPWSLGRARLWGVRKPIGPAF